MGVFDECVFDELQFIGIPVPSRYPHPSPDIRMRMAPPSRPEGEGIENSFRHSRANCNLAVCYTASNFCLVTLCERLLPGERLRASGGEAYIIFFMP